MVTYNDLPTPIHIINIEILKNNLLKLQYIKRKTGCRILFAIKGFSCDAVFPYIKQYVDGISASGAYEAKLGKHCFNSYIQTFSPAISDSTIDAVVENSDCVVLNSVTQWEKYSKKIYQNKCKCAIRINPECSVVTNFKVNSCHQYSRFGVRKEDISQIDLRQVDGFLFHNMCESGIEDLEKTLAKVGDAFSNELSQVQWVNIGGGQLFTEENYDLDRAIRSLNLFRNQFNVDLYMEPCTAIMYNTGVLISSVVDIVNNIVPTAILDVSAVCHLPDVLNHPYRIEVLDSGNPNEKEYKYKLAGATCYSGDIFGDYSFSKPLEVGQKIVFLDTAQYSMVKSMHFNGVPFPLIGIYRVETGYEIKKEYSYNTFLSII